MPFLTRITTTVGLILLAHAGYSAHEHSLLYGSVQPLPYDITLETIVSIILVAVGLILSAEKLRPISWSVWAGEIERKGGSENPFHPMEERTGFWDIRAKREEFANWVREQDAGTKR